MFPIDLYLMVFGVTPLGGWGAPIAEQRSKASVSRRKRANAALVILVEAMAGGRLPLCGNLPGR